MLASASHSKNHYWILKLAITLERSIFKNSNFKLSSNMSTPNRAAESGLNAKQIDTCIGFISWRAFIQNIIIRAPPGTTKKPIESHPIRLKFSEPVNGSPKRSIKINMAKTPEHKVIQSTVEFPYLDINLPENTVKTEAKIAPKITKTFPIKFCIMLLPE